MSVNKLCRITFWLTRNRFYTKLIYFSAWCRWENDLKTEFPEKYSPERIIFIHVKNSWDSNNTSRCIIGCKSLIWKYFFIFIVKNIRYVFFVFGFSYSTFTSVTCNELTATGKFIYCEQTTVCTAFTSWHGSRKFKVVNLVNGKHSRNLAFFVSFSCHQGSAESTHYTGNVRSYCLTAWYFLKTSENRIIIKCSTLNNDLLTKIFRVGYFDNLI